MEHKPGINDDNIWKLETVWMELLRQMVNGGWSRLPIPDNAEDKEFRRRYTNTDIPHIKKQKSKKCDQEPIYKTYLFCFLLSKHYAGKEDAVCRLKASTQTRPLDKYR